MLKTKVLAQFFYEGFLKVSSFKSSCQPKLFWPYPVKNKCFTQSMQFCQIKHNQENIGMK